MKKTSPGIVAIYHKNPKVKVSDVLTGFCRAPKFCDRHTDTHGQFLTQLKLRKGTIDSSVWYDFKNGCSKPARKEQNWSLETVHMDHSQKF